MTRTHASNTNKCTQPKKQKLSCDPSAMNLNVNNNNNNNKSNIYFNTDNNKSKHSPIEAKTSANFKVLKNRHNIDTDSDDHDELSVSSNDNDNNTDDVTTKRTNARKLISKRLWRGAEDRKLYKLVTKKGPSHWDNIATHFEHRSGKQCRERWVNHVAPNVNKAPWTEAEDQFLIAKVQELGTKWAAIAAMMPGRMDGAIKNRYMMFVRNQLAAKPASWRATANQHVTRGGRSPRSRHDSSIATLSRTSESNAKSFTSSPISMSEVPVSEPLCPFQLLEASHNRSPACTMITPPPTTSTPTRFTDTFNLNSVQPATTVRFVPISALIHESSSPLPSLSSLQSLHRNCSTRTTTPTTCSSSFESSSPPPPSSHFLCDFKFGVTQVRQQLAFSEWTLLVSLNAKDERSPPITYPSQPARHFQ